MFSQNPANGNFIISSRPSGVVCIGLVLYWLLRGSRTNLPVRPFPLFRPRSVSLCRLSRTSLFKFALSSEYVAPILCKDNFNGLCYVCHIRCKHINKCFGVYSVFGFLNKQGHFLCWASSDRLFNNLSVFPSFGNSFCFRPFVFLCL